MDYLSSVQRGIDYIEAHLDERFVLTAVSRCAGLSHWHYQRIFKALTGETLMAYVRARRLATAAQRLALTDERILDISLRAGFESQEAFTRAFKRSFGLNPGAYRKRGSRHLFLTKVQLNTDDLRHLHGQVSLEPELVWKPTLRLVGMHTTFFSVDSEKNTIGEALPPLWDSFLPRIATIDGAIDELCYGVISPVPETERLGYLAAVEARGSAPEGMIAFDVPAATYAIFTHRGPAKEIDRTVNYVYSTWLTRSKLRHTYGPDLELYGAQWHPTSPDSIMHYAIPVAP